MQTVSRLEKRKAKFRFALFYSLSLLLVFVLMSAFWRKFGTPGSEHASFEANEAESYFLPLDTALHRRLEDLDGRYSAYIKARKSGNVVGDEALLQAKNAFIKTLDSLDQQASYLKEGTKKTTLGFVTARFRKAVDDRESLMIDLMLLPRQAATAVGKTGKSADSAQLADLRRQLDERDARITALENAGAANGAAGASTDKDKQLAALREQLQQKEAALQAARNTVQTRPSAGGGEWQQKYLSLKSAFEKTSASEKQLREAYKNVADDNRRLLLQLQSMRKG